MPKYTLQEMAVLDIEKHRAWKEACAYANRLRNTPLRARTYEHSAFSHGVRAARLNAAYLHKVWATFRDRRLAACGAVLKYPKYQVVRRKTASMPTPTKASCHEIRRDATLSARGKYEACVEANTPLKGIKQRRLITEAKDTLEYELLVIELAYKKCLRTRS